MAESNVIEQEEKKTENVESSPKPEGKMAEFVDWIEGISVLELSQLVKALEDRLGVSVAAPVAVAAAGTPDGGGEAVAEEKTDFTVILTNAGSQKIQVIKEIRALTSLGLKDAKELADSIPKPIKEGASKEEAEEMKKKLEAAGGQVELK